MSLNIFFIFHLFKSYDVLNFRLSSVTAFVCFFLIVLIRESCLTYKTDLDVSDANSDSRFTH